MYCDVICLYVFFFKQKTAYEMRISDWSSDVCSSDLTLYLDMRQRQIDSLRGKGRDGTAGLQAETTHSQPGSFTDPETPNAAEPTEHETPTPVGPRPHPQR